MKPARDVYTRLRRTSGSCHVPPPSLRVVEHSTFRTMPEDSAYASDAQDDETATDGPTLAQDIRLVQTVIELCGMTHSNLPQLRSSAEHLSQLSQSSRTLPDQALIWLETLKIAARKEGELSPELSIAIDRLRADSPMGCTGPIDVSQTADEAEKITDVQTVMKAIKSRRFPHVPAVTSAVKRVRDCSRFGPDNTSQTASDLGIVKNYANQSATLTDAEKGSFNRLLKRCSER